MVMTRSSVGQPKLFVSRSLKWDQRVQKGPEILDFLSISIDAWARLLANKAPSRQSEDDGNARSLLAKTRSPGGNAQILQASATAVIAASLNRLWRNGRPVG